MTVAASASLEGARRLVEASDALLAAALAHTAELTRGGAAIDDHQPRAQRLASLATDVQAARELVTHGERLAARGAPDPLTPDIALAFAAELAARLRAAAELDPAMTASGAALESLTEMTDLVQAGQADEHLQGIGARVIAAGGTTVEELFDPLAALTRDSVRAFARSEVTPIAEEIHRRDLLVPEELIQKMAQLGFFGSSIPEEYGGSGMGALAMVVLTEELSAAALVAGSLITRPEILARALLQGGTEEQKRRWLPRIASGEVMVAVAVTEPDVGSDVASLQCRATPAEKSGRRGWLINGSKAWCTFAGRADVLALLARTNPDPAVGARGLSLFVVAKERTDGREFQQRQPGGGTLTGTALPTPGYRGMHSFVLAFDDFFVPAENLVGGEGGLNRGFSLQMSGFTAGRLQTAGRALGLAQAALERSCAYVSQRRQFGRPVSEFGLTQYTIGLMATHMAAARQLTYAAARGMEDPANRGLEAAMAKLLASDVAVRVTQEGQLLHGGVGYSEESAICRYVIDALVLPIFEGVKPILELKVIARSLLARTASR